MLIAVLSRLVLGEERWAAGFPQDRSHSCVGGSLFPSENPCGLTDALNRAQGCRAGCVLVLPLQLHVVAVGCGVFFLGGGGGYVAFLLSSQRICKYKLAYTGSL